MATHHPDPRRLIPLLLLLMVLTGAWWRSNRAAASDGSLLGSGTITATEVVVASEIGGRIVEVLVEEGERVAAGQTLIRLDDSLLRAQRQQAEAALSATRGAHAAARAALTAAEANHALLAAGPSDEQRDVAASAVARAEAAVEAAQSAYDALPDAARPTTQGQALAQSLAVAEATLDNARAQQAHIEAGARPQQLDAAAAQVDAARAQAEAAEGHVAAAQAALEVLDAQLARLTLAAPRDGQVLTRAIEPGEVALPGGTLLTLADLSDLTLTVYVPEDRYGTIRLGEEATVRVDSFPDERFRAVVQRVADRAEFTPRNVQTVAGRKSTVFAVVLHLVNPDGKLKPGMPADVTFAQ